MIAGWIWRIIKNMKTSANIQRKIDYKKLLTALAINAAFLIVLLLMFTPAEKTDDYSMKAILDGAYGYGTSSHLLYINFLLGSFLKILQNIAPVIPWYEVSNYAAIFISLTIVTYVVFSFEKIKRSVLILIPVLAFWGFEGYIKLTFSKTAGIAAASGLLVFMIGLHGGQFRKVHITVGTILTVIGCLFRYKVIFSVLPVMAGIALVEIIIWVRENKKDALKAILHYVIPVAALFAVIFLITQLGLFLFKRDPAWAEYKEYNTVKTDLQDYGWPKYSANAESYEELGVSNNDYKLWTRKDYSDPDVLTIDLMNSIADIKDRPGIVKYFTSFTAFFKEYPIELIKLNVFYGAVILLLLLCLSKQKSLKWLMILYPLGMALLLEYYLFCDGRYGRQHVDVAIWFAVSMFFVYYVRKKEISPSAYPVMGVAAAASLIFSINQSYQYITSETYDGSVFRLAQSDARFIVETLSKFENTLFVMSNNEYYGIMRAYGAFESIPEGQLDNIFLLSAYAYPSHRVVLDNFGINNIYASMLDDDVYYVSSDGKGNASTIRKYIREHYNENADFVQVYAIGSVNYFKFYDASLKKPKEVVLDSWRYFGLNPDGPLDLMELIEQQGELSNAVIVENAYEDKDGILCTGTLSRDPESTDSISSYVYSEEYIGCKVSVEDVTQYGYLYFQGKKVADYGQPAVYVYDQDGNCIYGSIKYYYSLDDEWTTYILDVTNLTGPVDIIFNGGYIDNTGSENSQYMFSDITLY